MPSTSPRASAAPVMMIRSDTGRWRGRAHVPVCGGSCAAVRTPRVPVPVWHFARHTPPRQRGSGPVLRSDAGRWRGRAAGPVCGGSCAAVRPPRVPVPVWHYARHSAPRQRGSGHDAPLRYRALARSRCGSGLRGHLHGSAPALPHG